MPGELIIGLMSGTSVDGIDAVLVEFESATQLRVCETQFTAFDTGLQQRINQLAQSPRVPPAGEYAQLDMELAQHYAAASESLIRKSGIARTSIAAIANHGQTIAHEPSANPPFSLQIGNAQAIADLTGITTIAQFRQADLAAGGQGAPLMPAFHQAIFGTAAAQNWNSNTNSKTTQRTFVLNLGGIANITALGETVIGFDTGPANTLLNQWISHCRQQSYDTDGAWAASGMVIPGILQQLLSDPYFSVPYPKSTGPDYFNLEWLRRAVPQIQQYPAADIQATLLAFSVETIALGIELFDTAEPAAGDNAGGEPGIQSPLYVCGGGVHNRQLMSRLSQRLASLEVKQTDVLGVPADWVEAAGFAWLGYCQLHAVPNNLPSVTGASRKLVLGEQFTPRSIADPH